jgi:hypothetical protein
VADGYRRIGTDFPGMGEHWLHPAALLSGTIDPARPTLLAYATIGGRPVLLGVGFVITTRGDAPAAVPGWPHAWHEHSGLLAHESGAAPAGHGDHAPGAAVAGGATPRACGCCMRGRDSRTRRGRYAPRQLALPFARAGVPPPPGTDADVGRAVALTVGGDAYLRDVLSDGGLRERRECGRGGLVDWRRAGRGRRRDGPSAARGRVGAADVTALRATWSELGRSLRARLGSAVDPYLVPPHPEPHAAPGDASPSSATSHEAVSTAHEPTPPSRARRVARYDAATRRTASATSVVKAIGPVRSGPSPACTTWWVPRTPPAVGSHSVT